MRNRIVLGLVMIAGAVLGYGYWHQQTHATLGISVRDASTPNRYQPLAKAELRLLAADGREMARAQSRPGGVVVLTAPREYSCHEIERAATVSAAGREAWDRCFAKQSRWLSTWLQQLKYIDLAVGNCRLRTEAAPRRSTDEWWLWWVPLPHLGGKPYVYYGVSLAVDAQDCSVVSDQRR